MRHGAVSYTHLNDAYAGGICGSAQSSFMSDCTSDTTDSYSALYSEGYVGGIAGNIYETEIYNTYAVSYTHLSAKKDCFAGLLTRYSGNNSTFAYFLRTISILFQFTKNK